MVEIIAEIKFATNYTVDQDEFTPDQLKFIEAQALIRRVRNSDDQCVNGLARSMRLGVTTLY